MEEIQITLEHLFQQLGLDASEKDMDTFVDQHQLSADISLTHADFWTDEQRQFIQQNVNADNQWAMMIEILNELLHGE